MKNREGFLGKVLMTWDFTTMTFEGIYRTGEDGGGAGAGEAEERASIVQEGARKK